METCPQMSKEPVVTNAVTTKKPNSTVVDINEHSWPEKSLQENY